MEAFQDQIVGVLEEIRDELRKGRRRAKRVRVEAGYVGDGQWLCLACGVRYFGHEDFNQHVMELAHCVRCGKIVFEGRTPASQIPSVVCEECARYRPKRRKAPEPAGRLLDRAGNLRRALDLLRASLDSDSPAWETRTSSIYKAEDLLSRELGHPIWEGRLKLSISRERTTSEKDADAQIAGNLRRALDLLRASLDSPHDMSDEDIERLHESEDLLSRQLGSPIWEGRTTSKEDDAAQLRGGAAPRKAGLG